MNSPLIIVRGLPGAGKSTFAIRLTEKLLEKGIQSGAFETDRFFCDCVTGEYKFDSGLCETAHNWTIGNVYRFCRDLTDCPCIVANSFTTNKEIQPYRNIARETGRPYIIVEVFDSHKAHKSIHDVPDWVMANMEKRWEDTNSHYRIYEDSDFDPVAERIVKERITHESK